MKTKGVTESESTAASSEWKELVPNNLPKFCDQRPGKIIGPEKRISFGINSMKPIMVTERFLRMKKVCSSLFLEVPGVKKNPYLHDDVAQWPVRKVYFIVIDSTDLFFTSINDRG